MIMFLKYLQKKAVPLCIMLTFVYVQLFSPYFLNTSYAQKTSNASDISDIEFFGAWDQANNVWLTSSKLNYEDFPGLAEVESNVKIGNYEEARSKLLNYFENRSTRVAPAYAPGKANPELVPLLMDQIITPLKDKYLTTFTVTDTPSTYNIDITAVSDSKVLSFILMGRYKGTNVTNFYSREHNCSSTTLAQCQPTLVVKYMYGDVEKTANLTASMDTYIRGNDSDSHGSEPLLQVLASGSPYDSKTREAYLKFDLSSIKGTITGATLKLSGSTEMSGNNDIMLYQTGNSAWDEATLIYNNHTGLTFSWQGIASGTDWKGPPTNISDDQFAMQITNFNFIQPLITEYVLTGTEDYAKKYIDYMIDFIDDAEDYITSDSPKGAGTFPKSFQASIRAYNWVKSYNVLKNSSSMNPSANTDILKTFWKKADYLVTEEGYHPVNNHGVFETLGLYSIAVYFPEFTDSKVWHSKADKRMSELIETLNFSDGSYNESSSSYAVTAANQFFEFKEFGRMNSQNFDPDFDQYLLKMGKYFADLSFPNGFLPLFGDSSRMDAKNAIKRTGDLFDDDTLRFVGTSGAEGTPPAYSSVLYPQSKTAIMRSGWTTDDQYLMMNTKQEISHRHPDDNAIIYYANGRPLLVDPGTMSYSDEPISNWLRYSTEAHNTIEMNDTAQNWTEGFSQKLSSYSRAEGSLEQWVDNQKFNFVEGDVRNVPGFTHVRDVLFLKSSFSIVSDYLHSPGGTNKYQQTWHFLPTANPVINENSKRVSTVFNDTYGDIQVIPADPDQITASLDDGYYSEAFYSVTKSKYASFTKNVEGDVTFDTVLYPTKGEDNRDIQVNRLDITPSVSTTVASSLKINNIADAGTKGYYYVSHEEVPRFTRFFDTFTFDGKMTYIEKTDDGIVQSALIKSGSTLKNNGIDLIASKMEINDVAVDWKGSSLDINSSNLVMNNNPNDVSSIAIYAPGVQEVKLNGNSLSNFTVYGDYIYAVGVPTWSSSSELSSTDLGSDHTGIQTIEFDLIPTVNNSGSMIGYTAQASAVADEAELPMLLSLSEDGFFEVWNGTAFSQSTSLSYKAGERYHVTILADLYSKTYNLYIAPKGKPEVLVADQFVFNNNTPAISDIGQIVIKSPSSHKDYIFNHTIRDASYYTINIAADTYKTESNPTKNYGIQRKIEIRNASNPKSNYSGYLRFNVGELPPNVTPVFSKLRLTSATTGEYTDQLHQVTDDAWDELTLVHNNAPAPGEIIASWNMPPAEQEVMVDVQQQIINEIAGDKQLTLMISSQTTGNKSHFYYAKENNNGMQQAQIRIYTKNISTEYDRVIPETRALITPFEPDGSNGWYVNPVSVSLSVYGDSSEVLSTEYSWDGGQTWNNYLAPLMVEKDGQYSLIYRSKSQDGIMEVAKNIRLKLDGETPGITVTGIVYGSFNSADDITPVVTLSDHLSGVDHSKTQIVLDGVPVQSGESIALYTLSLGMHQFIVNGSDLAGNKSRHTVTFETLASLDGLKQLVTRFADDHWIDNSGITNSLEQKLERGDLQSFIDEVRIQRGKHIHLEAANYLVRDAEALLT
jgi:hypothetical protein